MIMISEDLRQSSILNSVACFDLILSIVILCELCMGNQSQRLLLVKIIT